MIQSLPFTLRTIALLNVRSLLTKVPDIRADRSLMSASIQCFCKTWLNASQPSPVLKDDQIDIRCDRMSCENKGGFVMIVPRQMHPCNTWRFGTNGVEPYLLLLRCPMLNRSPSIPETMFTSVLHRLLTHLSLSNTACMILGDFNEDLLHKQNPTLLTIMVLYN